ncbi:MAG: DUF2304 domain-containing protein [Candidatus Diapherotrites archaeon]|uniref:DUF2304 domain-containing protein n=1 Tax=Candidatus Iainarchaeum sp. TaxID=3101447 RepID=A0A8T4LAC0_9ARCH|nr:DUF2304 domain-containing protein [Candidatus Diapherotrites archaeon]
MSIILVGLVFSAVMLYFTHLYYRRGQFSRRDFAFWALIWVGFGVLLLTYQGIQQLSHLFGVIRFLDFVTILAVMALFALMFYVFERMRLLQKKIEKIVEAVALREAKK